MERETETFGNQLRRFRKEHLLTQQKMASLLGISTNHVGVLERGIKKPRASTEAAFARLSGINGNQRMRLNDKTDLRHEEMDELLWKRLCELDEKRRAEVIDIFFRILEWTKVGVKDREMR